MTTSYTSTDIQQYLLRHFKTEIADLGLDPSTLPPEFDFLETGVVDSLGILDMISSIEQQFAITVDLEGLDAEQLTILGPLCDYIAATGVPAGPAA